MSLMNRFFKIFLLITAFTSLAKAELQSFEATGTNEAVPAEVKKEKPGKKAYQFGICVGQNLAQQGVVVTIGQKLDESYREHVKLAKTTCREQAKAAASVAVVESNESSISEIQQ